MSRHETTDSIGVAKHAFYLAWQACGVPVGMGRLQDRPAATEDDVWGNVTAAGDYASGTDYKPREPYGDYVFGRMMKLGILVETDAVEVRNHAPALDYQAWCGVYPTYDALIEAAIASLASR